jgi:drug/metabolite transporter (DMT)-like permease
MFPSWIFLILTSTIIAALVTLLDSHLLTQRMPSWRAYVVLCDLFITMPASIAMLFIFPLPPLGIKPLLAVLAATLCSSIAGLFILRAMQSEHISRIVPLTSTTPVFVAILAFMFLGESLSWSQILGIIFVVGGAMLISLKPDTKGNARFDTRTALMLLAAALLIAVGSVANKYALGYMSYWNDATLIFISSAVLFLSVSIRPSVIREIKTMRQRNLSIGLAWMNSIFSLFVAILAYEAVQLGPVALVSSVSNIRPLFVFVFSSAAGQFFPRFLPPEHNNRKLMLIKTGATLAVAGGLVVMLL